MSGFLMFHTGLLKHPLTLLFQSLPLIRCINESGCQAKSKKVTSLFFIVIFCVFHLFLALIIPPSWCKQAAGSMTLQRQLLLRRLMALMVKTSEQNCSSVQLKCHYGLI